MDTVLIDSFTRLLDEAASPATVHAAEVEGHDGGAWKILAESGFADALLEEAYGGFGLAISDVVPLLLAAGERSLPVPLGETMLARALLGSAGYVLPVDLPVLLWPHDGRGLRSAIAPAAAGRGYALRQTDEEVDLLELDTTAERDGFGFRCAALRDAAPLLSFRAPPDLLFTWAAALTAVTVAGGVNRLVAMTVRHANDRSQFGRAIAKFQAIQHQISILAEQSAMAGMAAMIAFKDATLREGPCRWRVAAARSVAGEAAATGAAIAHAVHGAIGVSLEHELQIVTRRLKRLQLSFGARDYWSAEVGATRLEADHPTTVDFIRSS